MVLIFLLAFCKLPTDVLYEFLVIPKFFIRQFIRVFFSRTPLLKQVRMKLVAVLHLTNFGMVSINFFMCLDVSAT